MNNTELSSECINIENVYELASEIGEHFKKLINHYGPEPNEALIPTVVRVLEYLEEVVIQREDYLLLVDKLHRQIEELQKEHHERIQQQIKFQSEIEDIDESWRNENTQLSQYVKYLRSENKRLTSSLKSNDKFSQSLTDLKHDDEDKQLTIVQNDSIQNPNDAITSRLQLLNKEIELKNYEINSLQTQIDNLTKENANLRSMVTLSKNNRKPKSNQKDDLKENEYLSEHNCKILLEKVKQLENELEKCKNENVISLEKNKNDESKKIIEEETEECIKMEDLPVQGPIPKEPDEKLYYNRPSRIWSFFPRLTRVLIKQ